MSNGYRAQSLTLIAVILFLGGNYSPHEAWGQVTFSVNARGAFLHTVGDNPASPTIVDLAAAGFAPGEVLWLTYEVSPPGFSFYSCDGPFVGAEQTSVLGVFSGSSILRPTSALARVPDAIDAGLHVATAPTFVDNEWTDIPEDFQIFPPGSFAVEVPPRATHLFLGTGDSYWGDNCGTITITMGRTPPPTVALLSLDPDVFDVEVSPDQEAEEPEDEFLTAFVKLPVGMNAADIDVTTVTLLVNEVVLATAEDPLVLDDVLRVLFRLNLTNISTMLGLDITEVKVDESSRKLEVKATTTSQSIDLTKLVVTGQLFDTGSFSASDAVQVRLKE